jgi:hypothetical protein
MCRVFEIASFVSLSAELFDICWTCIACDGHSNRPFLVVDTNMPYRLAVHSDNSINNDFLIYCSYPMQNVGSFLVLVQIDNDIFISSNCF